MIGLLFALAHYTHSPSGALLPDPKMTPGVVRTTNAAVVCTPGYAKAMRKLVHKKTLLIAFRWYGVKWEPKKAEADHLISDELGGEPDDPRNIWKQPYPQAHYKDAVENYLHRQVCSGAMKLTDAQRMIRTDWTQ